MAQQAPALDFLPLLVLRWYGVHWCPHCHRCAPCGPALRGDMVTIDLQPTLRGALLELRPLRADDWDALYAVASDPLIWEQHPDRERYTEPIFREFFRVALESQSALVAIDVQSGHVVGSSRYHGYDETLCEIEIGWSFLARSHWGGRHNGEMKQLMLQHAFRFVDRVIFVIGPQNVRSQRAVQQIGAVLVGPLTVRGQESVVYRLVKPRDIR